MKNVGRADSIIHKFKFILVEITELWLSPGSTIKGVYCCTLPRGSQDVFSTGN